MRKIIQVGIIIVVAAFLFVSGCTSEAPAEQAKPIPIETPIPTVIETPAPEATYAPPDGCVRVTENDKAFTDAALLFIRKEITSAQLVAAGMPDHPTLKELREQLFRYDECMKDVNPSTGKTTSAGVQRAGEAMEKASGLCKQYIDEMNRCSQAIRDRQQTSTSQTTEVGTSQFFFTGEGDVVKKFVVNRGGDYIIKATASTSERIENFAVFVKDSTGDKQLVFNEIVEGGDASYKGEQFISLSSGTAYLIVEGGAFFTITINPA